jgi:hypothetical protein
MEEIKLVGGHQHHASFAIAIASSRGELYDLARRRDGEMARTRIRR